jgi:GTP-binding protein
MPARIAIVGRPNVGKSTLFNRLVGRGRALVDPTPGVTRDRIEGDARLGHLELRAIDTAGFEKGTAGSLEGRLRKQTEAALAESDAALLVIDAKAGVTALDAQFATWLRRQPTPVIVVANKCEGAAAEASASEAWGLGLGPPIPISAQNGEGLADLVEALRVYTETPVAIPETASETEPPRRLRLVVAGRPNVGKSSLVNRLLQDERLLVGPEPGLTRDAVTIAWEWQGREVELVDTAGLRRRSRIEPGSLERLSSRASLAALRRADVVLLLTEASTPLEKQDLAIANQIIELGRAPILALNKWDLVKDEAAARALVRGRLESRLPQVKGVDWLPISVLTGQNVDRLLPAVIATYDRWATRIPTAALNRWLEEATTAHPPPMSKGRRVRLRYATQVAQRPPTIVLFVSQKGALPDAYLRYLVANLRQAFDVGGVPIRLLLRTGENPYA